MTKVIYRIFEDEDLNKQPLFCDSNICFRDLHFHFNKMQKNGLIKYLIHKTLDKQIARWYSKELNKAGFPHIFLNGEKYYNCFVKKQESYVQTLAILTALRYLEEVPFPTGIKWLYDNHGKHSLPFLTTFQLMHHCSNVSFTSNHAFISGGGSYIYGYIYPLISNEEFKINWEKAGKTSSNNSIIGIFNSGEVNKLFCSKKGFFANETYKKIRDGNIQEALKLLSG